MKLSRTLLSTLSLLALSCLAEANCVGDCQNGYGIYTWAHGDKYVGEFKDDNMHGQGTMTFSSGNKRVGVWKDGKLNGNATYYFANGRTDTEKWVDGKEIE